MKFVQFSTLVSHRSYRKAENAFVQPYQVFVHPVPYLNLYAFFLPYPIPLLVSQIVPHPDFEPG